MSLTPETKAAVKARMADRGSSYRQALSFVMAEREAARWNELYPIGTNVVVTPYRGCTAGLLFATRTRSIAWVMPSGSASVMVDGKASGYDLAFVKPIEVAQ